MTTLDAPAAASIPFSPQTTSTVGACMSGARCGPGILMLTPFPGAE